jgi:hypothetical protein
MASVLDLSELLRLSDLLSFKSKFEAVGVSKLEHIEDVDEEDLKDFGMSVMNILLFLIFLLICTKLTLISTYRSLSQ